MSLASTESLTKLFGPSDDGKPLCIDLFCGLGGWTEGFLAEGYRVIGFDIEAHRYPKRIMHHDDQKTPTGNNSAAMWKDRPIARYAHPTPAEMDLHGTATEEWMEYPGTLILRDIRSIHGSELKDAAVIVASPPCQKYSYMAMPWKRAKAQAEAIREDLTGEKLQALNELFSACFRLQSEAIEAAGHFIPLIVENVRGAQEWVGRASWNYGSFYLWGDVPALMPHTFKGTKLPPGNSAGKPLWKDRDVSSCSHYNLDKAHLVEAHIDGRKVSMNFHEHEKTGKPGRSFQSAAVAECGIKQAGISGIRENGKGDKWFQDGAARHGSKSNSRRAASAMIAKIPFPLSQHVARTFKPKEAML